MSVAISLSGLGKRYTLRHQSQEAYLMLREVLPRVTKDLGRRLLSTRTKPATPAREEFWALRDVDLAIQEGDRVGIIGRNGAGKSTLLKLISRIVEPTVGSIRIRGRVASMLEVGTGFHPELTGRENVFLSGAILGMRRAEIARRFDEIVAFADVEKFLDTPTKRYSSGMYMRLAFAVAAHLQTEILVVDEVLAVGDVQFQKKCLGKMEQVGKEGRTVLFVSHNMAAIEGLCTRAVVLERGRLVSEGGVSQQIAAYLDSMGRLDSQLAEPVEVGGLRVERLEVAPNPVESGAGAVFLIEMTAKEPVVVERIAVLLHSRLGARVGVLDLRRSEPYRLGASDVVDITARVESVPLVEGDYGVGLYVMCGGEERNINDLLYLTVKPRPVAGEVIPYSPGARGIVQFAASFEVASRVRSQRTDSGLPFA